MTTIKSAYQINSIRVHLTNWEGGTEIYGFDDNDWYSHTLVFLLKGMTDPWKYSQ